MFRAPDPEREARDWPQDALMDEDNGAYWHRCAVCGKEFTGHKRRPVCRVCTGDRHKGRGTGRTTRMLRRAIKAANQGKVLVVGADFRHCNMLKSMAGAIAHEEGFPERQLDNIEFVTIENRTALHGRDESTIFHDHYALESLSERTARGPKSK